jgi:putative phosphoribosyl transferase
VEGATHLFEEPGTLEKVADLAGEWFSKHFNRHTGATRTAQ